MSKYPIPAAGQGLYEASQTQVHDLGTIHIFDTDLGPVEAVYVKNNNAASIAQGLAVGHPWDNDASPWAVDSAAFANVSAARGNYVGILCASMQGTATSLSGTGYAWAAHRGAVTCAALAENVASNALLYVSVNSAALLASVATAVVTANVAMTNVVGRYGATASTLSRASTTNVDGHFVQLFGWR